MFHSGAGFQSTLTQIQPPQAPQRTPSQPQYQVLSELLWNFMLVIVKLTKFRVANDIKLIAIYEFTNSKLQAVGNKVILKSP